MPVFAALHESESAVSVISGAKQHVDRFRSEADMTRWQDQPHWSQMTQGEHPEHALASGSPTEFFGLTAIQPPPAPRAAAHALCESARQVALIDETTGERDFGEFKICLLHKLFGAFDALN